MIKLGILTDGKKVFDSLDVDKPTLKECALIVYRLEQIKENLINRDFVSELEISENNDEDIEK